MTPFRKILRLSVLPLLFLPIRGLSQTQGVPPPKPSPVSRKTVLEIWTEKLTEPKPVNKANRRPVQRQESLDTQTREGFAKLDDETQFTVLQTLWAKIPGENVRGELLVVATEDNSGAQDRLRNTPHLLELLDLGANDPAESVQQQALSLADGLAMQSFEDKDAYFAWRKTTGTKPPETLVQESMQTFVSQFKSADNSEKVGRFDTLLLLPYYTSRIGKTAGGQTTYTLTMAGLEKARRDAVIESGLLETMAELLHKEKDPDLAQKAMTFLVDFLPDEAYLRRVEPDVQRLFEARLTQGEDPQNGPGRDDTQFHTLDLLFAYRSAWVMPFLVHWTQRDYLTAGRDSLVSALTQANDTRTLPILIALSETMNRNESGEIFGDLSSLTGVAANADHDSVWWRNWWEKNKAAYPAEIRDVTIPGLKTGIAALEARILNSAVQYGLDYRIRNQFMELDTKTRYTVLKDLWSKNVSNNVKTNLLMAVGEGQYGNSQLPDNPYLLEELHPGMIDEDEQVQQTAANILFLLTLRTFASTDDYLNWHKQNAMRPLSDLVREGATTFVSRFKQADEGQKVEMLQRVQQIPFVSSVKIGNEAGKQTEIVTVTGLAEVRRKAVLVAGLPDAVAALAHSENPVTVQTAANFLLAFHAGASYLAALEPDIKRIYAQMLAKPDENQTFPLSLLLLYHAPWVGEMMTQIVEKTYLTPNNQNALRGLIFSSDPRTVPLLISLLDSVGKGMKQQISQQLEHRFRVTPDAAHDSAWWRDWWKKGLEKMPEEVQAIPLLELKKGRELLVYRLTQDGADWNAVQLLDALDEETQYDVLRENWKKIKAEALRVNILENICNRSNPQGFNGQAEMLPHHLLDILGLAVGDSAAQVRNDALGFVNNIACRRIADAKEYAEWRKAVGDKPLPEIVREGTQALIANMAAADTNTLSGLLDEAAALQWFSYQSDGNGIFAPDMKVTAIGLTAVRRKAALDAKLPDKLADWLRPNQPETIARKALELVMTFLPGRAFMQRTEPDIKRLAITRPLKKEQYDFSLAQIAGYYDSPWATDIVLNIARTQYESHSDDVIALLSGSRDMRVIPALITALGDIEEDSWQRQQINLALARLTHRLQGTIHDANWWRDWWKKNADALPETARNEPFPNFQARPKLAKEYSLRRGKKQITIGGDPKRAYWFLTSGLLLKRKPDAKATVKPVANVSDTDFTAIPAAERPGLIVVLAEGDAEGTAAQYWQDVIGKGLGGKYLVALAIAPKWRENQTPRWLTKRERGGIKEASFTTEAFAAQIARDVAAKFPVNPGRVYLAGVGTGGQAVYACSLEAQTPFKGFALLDSPFHPAALPPLTNAKGRRYLLLHNPQDKQAPYFLAKVAQQTLQKAGAEIKLTPTAIPTDAAQVVPRDAVVAGVKWLETK